MGVKISTIPVFSAEVSPASIRGGLVTSFQLWVAFGILVYVPITWSKPEYPVANYIGSGFCSNLVFYRIGPLAWRFQLSAAFVPAIPVLIFVWFCPGKIDFSIILNETDFDARVAKMAYEEVSLQGCLRVFLSLAQHGIDCR